MSRRRGQFGYGQGGESRIELLELGALGCDLARGRDDESAVVLVPAEPHRFDRTQGEVMGDKFGGKPLECRVGGFVVVNGNASRREQERQKKQRLHAQRIVELGGSQSTERTTC